MSDGLLVRHCAPTMANIKTGSLFCGSFSSEKEMISDIRHLNLRLKNKGIRFLPMNYKDGRGLIYVYRPKRLINDLQDCEACRILRGFGYSCSDENACLRRLICRIKQEGDFPHEIGLFLGYPPKMLTDSSITKENANSADIGKFMVMLNQRNAVSRDTVNAQIFIAGNGRKGKISNA